MFGIIGSATVEILKALVFRIAWRAVLERFLSRLAVYSLRKVASMTTNQLAKETAEDVIASLRRDDLPALK